MFRICVNIQSYFCHNYLWICFLYNLLFKFRHPLARFVVLFNVLGVWLAINDSFNFSTSQILKKYIFSLHHGVEPPLSILAL